MSPDSISKHGVPLADERRTEKNQFKKLYSSSRSTSFTRRQTVTDQTSTPPPPEDKIAPALPSTYIGAHAHLSNEPREQRVGGNVERNAEAHVRAALVHLAGQLPLGHVELAEHVARRQGHLAEIRGVPRRENDSPVLGVSPWKTGNMDRGDIRAGRGGGGCSLVDKRHVTVLFKWLLNGALVEQASDRRPSAEGASGVLFPPGSAPPTQSLGTKNTVMCVPVSIFHTPPRLQSSQRPSPLR